MNETHKITKAEVVSVSPAITKAEVVSVSPAMFGVRYTFDDGTYDGSSGPKEQAEWDA